MIQAYTYSKNLKFDLGHDPSVTIFNENGKPVLVLNNIANIRDLYHKRSFNYQYIGVGAGSEMEQDGVTYVAHIIAIETTNGKEMVESFILEDQDYKALKRMYNVDG